MAGPALPADERPVDRSPVNTDGLPPTPVRDRNIPAGAWLQAPAELLALGEPFGGPEAMYKRRLGPWLLWRSGPASRGDACYLAIHVDDLTRQHAFRLTPDGTGSGTGPSGTNHERFRTWKQDLISVDDD